MPSFLEIEKEVAKRIKQYAATENCSVWSPDKNVTEISAEFDAIRDWRMQSWYHETPALIEVIRSLGTSPKVDYAKFEPRSDFVLAPLFPSKLSRHIEVTAFAYNCTAPEYYNSSTIVWKELKFLALDAPLTPNDTKRLFRLLGEHPVTDLVRLTPEYEYLPLIEENANKTVQRNEKSYPYWLGKSNGSVLVVEGKPININYYQIENWMDNLGANPQDLLDLVLKVRKNLSVDFSLIAVHCHSGVGRTGTFIAAFILIHEIEEKLKNGEKLENLNVGIQEIVKILSMQRYHMVSSPGYNMLYKVCDLYCQLKQKDNNEIAQLPSAQNDPLLFKGYRGMLRDGVIETVEYVSAKKVVVQNQQ